MSAIGGTYNQRVRGDDVRIYGWTHREDYVAGFWTVLGLLLPLTMIMV